ncbi:MAG: diguanylate cyclase [Hungatella sp.]|nr:diguanylate cyclase [Hungatella sp.]
MNQEDIFLQDRDLIEKWVKELVAYSAELSQGKISRSYPSGDNPFCENLKNLHDSLKRLTWQAEQVAAGDYSQTFTYPGEFAEAFNTMTAQLKERESQLKREKYQVEQEAEIVKGYNELLLELTRKQKEWILVVDVETKDIVYCNKRGPGQEELHDSAFCEVCEHRLPFRQKILGWEDKGQSNIWEIGDGDGHYYRATTFPLEWRKREAYAHILTDITDEKKKTSSLKDKAYHDALTGVYNRVYFEEYMERVLAEKENINLGYLDLDCLKTVNDQYGHAEGDAYILRFVSTIRKYFRTSDKFSRIGGDEFCLVLKDIQREVVMDKLNAAMKEFQSFDDKEYTHGFSFGVVEVKCGEETRPLKEIIEEADAAMYECKRRNKELYRRRREEKS